MFRKSVGKIEMPSLPNILTRIIQLTSNPDTNADDLAGVVLTDQSMTSKILRLANSAYFARRKKADTVSEAVTILGFGFVRNLAASASILDAFFPTRVFVGFDWQKMWTHCVITAIASEAIYNLSNAHTKRHNEAVFVSGLIHDVGKMIIAQALPHKFSLIVEHCKKENVDMAVSELVYLSTNHTFIGKELGIQWKLPENLVAGMAFHHAPYAASSHENIARAVSAANMLAKRIDRNYIIGLEQHISKKEIAETAGLHVEQIDYVVKSVYIGLEKCKELINWSNEFPILHLKAA